MKNAKFKFAFVVLLISSLISGAKVEPSGTNGIKTNNISQGFTGSTYRKGLSFSQMFTHKLSFEIDAGLLFLAAGFTFYFTNPQ